MVTTDLQIWTLGLKNSNADKSITWDEPFPNFNEEDVLIIDLNSLTDEILKRIDKLKFREARNQIFNKFINGGTIIFITAPYRRMTTKGNNDTKAKNINSKVRLINPPIYPIYSNYYLSPIEFTSTNVKEGKRIKYQQGFFSSYLSNIGSFSYYLHDFNISPSFTETPPTNDTMSTIIKSLERQSNNVSRNVDVLELVKKKLASDNSNNVISVECWLKVDGYWDSGKSIYLPAPKNGISISDAIDLIINKYGKRITSQILPDWVYNVPLSTVNELKRSLSTLISKRKAVDKEIKGKEDKIRSTQKYYRLLVSKDKLLVKTVAEALKFLGIEDVQEKGGADEEDLIFQFRYVSEFKSGVIEIHGTERNITLKKLGQCHKWVENHLMDVNENVVKGIVISNQYIDEPYPQSKDKKLKFESHQLDYIKKREMCIIPSCVLFAAVARALGGIKTSRETLERIIGNSNEVIATLSEDR